jgi:2-methylcitrate dehydratase PrpD
MDEQLSDARDPLAVRMSRAIAGFSARELTPEVAEKAKLCILDLLSCALASAALPWSRQAVALATADVQRPASGRGASIVGTAHVVSTHDAAFANAVLGHGLVRDDMHLGSVSHLGTVILPALLALAERAPVSGSSLLAALVAGYEAGGNIGRAILDVEVSRIFRPTGITGPIAAAAAGARLLGLEQDEIACSLALAANTAAGYNEWAATGGTEMFFHVGFAARNAITAVLLGAAGAHVSRTAIDGRAGMLAAFGKEPDPAIPGLFEDRPEILAVFFKPVPACNFAQASAQAALAIAQRHGAQDENVARITVRVPYAAAHYPGCDSSGPFEHILQAKMSIQYNVAAALAKGNFDEANYEPQANSDVLKVAALATLEVDDELTRAFPAQQGAEVVVHLRDGTELAQRADGIIAASEGEVRARFERAASAALGAQRAAEIRRFVYTLESADDAGALGRLTRATGAPGETPEAGSDASPSSTINSASATTGARTRSSE